MSRAGWVFCPSWRPSCTSAHRSSSRGVRAGAARPTQRRVAAGPNTRRGPRRFGGCVRPGEQRQHDAAGGHARTRHGSTRRLLLSQHRQHRYGATTNVTCCCRQRQCIRPLGITQQPLHQRRFDPQPLPGCGGAARRAGDDLDVPPETGEFDADHSASEYYGAGQAIGRNCVISAGDSGSRLRYSAPAPPREYVFVRTSSTRLKRVRHGEDR